MGYLLKLQLDVRLHSDPRGRCIPQRFAWRLLQHAEIWHCMGAEHGSGARVGAALAARDLLGLAGGAPAKSCCWIG